MYTVYTVYDESLRKVESIKILSELQKKSPSDILRVTSVPAESAPLLRLYVKGRGYSGGHNTAARQGWSTVYPEVGYHCSMHRLVAWEDATVEGSFTGYYPGIYAYYAPKPDDLVVVQARFQQVEAFGLVQPNGHYTRPSGFFFPPAMVPFAKAIAFADWARGWVTSEDPTQELFDSFLHGDPPWRNT